MVEFYFHEKKDCCILLAFHKSDGTFIKGFVVPLDLIDSKICIGGCNLETLKELLYPLKDEQNRVMMAVRTYNFIVPGIGNERSFLLNMDSSEGKISDAADEIRFQYLLRFLRGIRKHGRLCTVNCIDDSFFNRIQEWKNLSFRHLLECTGLDIPLVNDKRNIVDPDNGLFHCEKRAMPGDNADHFQHQMISPKGKMEGGMSARDIRRKLVSGCLSDSSSLEEVETPIDTSYFDKLTIEQKEFAKAKVLRTYQMLCNPPDDVFAFLANRANWSIIEGHTISINPQLVIVLMGNSCLTLANICESWFEEVCNAGHKVDFIPPAVLDSFEIRSPQVKKLVLSLDHYNHKPEASVCEVDDATGKVPSCCYCGLEGVHLPIKCPILDSRTLGNYELEKQRRCLKCYSSECQLEGNECHLCGSNVHVCGACYDENAWDLCIRPAIRNQHFIIAATQNLNVDQLNVLHKKIPLALQQFEVHQAEHLSCGW